MRSRLGVLPRFVRVLLDDAEMALADAVAGLVKWADGQVDDDGLDAYDRADTIDLTVGGRNSKASVVPNQRHGVQATRPARLQ